MRTRLFIVAALLCAAIGLRAQQNNAELYEIIPLTPYISEETNLAPEAEALLLNRMRQAALKHGLSAMENQVYVLTTSTNILDKQLTGTVPQNWVVEVEVHFYIGNGVDGTLYASTAITRKGVGPSEEKAFINCYNLTKIEFPASVTYIGKDAFKACTDLKEIIFKGRKNLDGIDIYDTWLTDGRHGKIFFEP